MSEPFKRSVRVEKRDFDRRRSNRGRQVGPKSCYEVRDAHDFLIAWFPKNLPDSESKAEHLAAAINAYEPSDAPTSERAYAGEERRRRVMWVATEESDE